MATAAQNIAATTAAVQAAAVADLTLMSAFIGANTAAFTTLLTNFTTLAAGMSSTGRQAQCNQIKAELQQVVADCQTLLSQTTAAQTATPVA